MTMNRYRYFRWTPRTALITFNYVVVVPAILMAVAYSTEVRLATGTKARPRKPRPWRLTLFATMVGQVELPGEAKRRPGGRVLDGRSSVRGWQDLCTRYRRHRDRDRESREYQVHRTTNAVVHILCDDPSAIFPASQHLALPIPGYHYTAKRNMDPKNHAIRGEGTSGCM